MAKTYYEIMGVSPKATPEEIQAAYRRLATQFHPDANPGNAEAVEKFKAINKAYETLRKPKERELYDATLQPVAARPTAASKSGPRPAGTATAPGPRPPTTGNPFQDVLNGMRAGGVRPPEAEAPSVSLASDSEGPIVEIWLTQAEALRGTTKTIRVNGKPLRLRIGIRR